MEQRVKHSIAQLPVMVIILYTKVCDAGENTEILMPSITFFQTKINFA